MLAYIPPSAGAVSLGFATPSVVATNIADQLVARGRATHPALGIRVSDLTPHIAQTLGASASSGAVVVEVENGGPADQAGLRRGDVITGLGGEEVNGYASLLGALRRTNPGDRVQVQVDRGGEKRTVTVTVGSR